MVAKINSNKPKRGEIFIKTKKVKKPKTPKTKTVIARNSAVQYNLSIINF